MLRLLVPNGWLVQHLREHFAIATTVNEIERQTYLLLLLLHKMKMRNVFQFHFWRDTVLLTHASVGWPIAILPGKRRNGTHGGSQAREMCDGNDNEKWHKFISLTLDVMRNWFWVASSLPSDGAKERKLRHFTLNVVDDLAAMLHHRPMQLFISLFASWRRWELSV